MKNKKHVYIEINKFIIYLAIKKSEKLENYTDLLLAAQSPSLQTVLSSNY